MSIPTGEESNVAKHHSGGLLAAGTGAYRSKDSSWNQGVFDLTTEGTRI